MLKNGYIKLYRSLLDWEWYDDTVTKCLFLHLLLTVNAYDEDWKGIVIKTRFPCFLIYQTIRGITFYN